MRHPEIQLQIAVADYLRLVCPHPWTHIAHGSFKLDKRTAARLKAQGLMPGWPDYIILVPGGTIQIETKAGKGQPSPEQRAHAAWMQNHYPGHHYHVCRSVDDVEGVLRQHGVPLRGRAA